MRDSLKRWAGILKSLKKHDRRFELIQSDLAFAIRRQYESLVVDKGYRASLRGREYSVYAQNGEDGLILFILSQIGIGEGRFVEIGIGDGRQCNTSNLSLSFGWSGLMIDGDPGNVRKAKEFFRRHDNAYPDRVQIEHAFVTRGNVNRIIEEANIAGEIDLLSIDIDGNDYWVWESIRQVNPRLVVIEYNASFGPDRSITVEYDPGFERYKVHPTGWYHGASLRALTCLGDSKGYVLVGCDSEGVNAFFVRGDLALGELRALSASEAYYAQAKRSAKMSTEEQFAKISHLKFAEVRLQS